MTEESYLNDKKAYKSLSDIYDSANNYEYVQSYKK